MRARHAAREARHASEDAQAGRPSAGAVMSHAQAEAANAARLRELAALREGVGPSRKRRRFNLRLEP